jgi:uncharacterized SAM-dependent methyltransferase
MHLEALDDIAFEVAGRRFALGKGETIHTENSHKFDRAANTRCFSRAAGRRSSAGSTRASASR